MAYSEGTKLRAIDNTIIEDEVSGIEVEIPSGGVVTILSGVPAIAHNIENGHEVEYQLATYRDKTLKVRTCDFQTLSS